MRALLAALSLGLALATPASAQTACGTADTPCALPEGDYLMERPEAAPVAGAVVFLHGWGSSAAGVLRNRAVVDPVLARGYAMVAPNGTPRDSGGGRRWSFHPAFPQDRDEAAFFASLIDDLANRHGVPRDRILLSGFSAGGFMTSYLACAEPDIAAAYAPVSGGFWRPHPEACAGPVRLLHVHGWSDPVVPLEGRFLRNGEVAQGDIFHGLEIWRAANGCDAMRPDSFATDGAAWRRVWTDCTPGSALEFVLFPGGHQVPAWWADMALDWFEGLAVPKG